MRANDLIRWLKNAVEKYGDLRLDCSGGKTIKNQTLYCTPVDDIYVAISDNKKKIIIGKI